MTEATEKERGWRQRLMFSTARPRSDQAHLVSAVLPVGRTHCLGMNLQPLPTAGAHGSTAAETEDGGGGAPPGQGRCLLPPGGRAGRTSFCCFSGDLHLPSSLPDARNRPWETTWNHSWPSSLLWRYNWEISHIFKWQSDLYVKNINQHPLTKLYFKDLNSRGINQQLICLFS